VVFSSDAGKKLALFPRKKVRLHRAGKEKKSSREKRGEKTRICLAQKTPYRHRRIDHHVIREKGKKGKGDSVISITNTKEKLSPGPCAKIHADQWSSGPVRSLIKGGGKRETSIRASRRYQLPGELSRQKQSLPWRGRRGRGGHHISQRPSLLRPKRVHDCMSSRADQGGKKREEKLTCSFLTAVKETPRLVYCGEDSIGRPLPAGKKKGREKRGGAQAVLRRRSLLRGKGKGGKVGFRLIQGAQPLSPGEEGGGKKKTSLSLLVPAENEATRDLLEKGGGPLQTPTVDSREKKKGRIKREHQMWKRRRSKHSFRCYS